MRIVFSGDAGSATRAVKGLEGSFHSLGRVMKTALAIGGGVMIASGLRAAGQAALSFDKSMRNVNSIAKLSEAQFQSLSTQVLALAGPTAQAPTKLADGLYDIVSSGFKAQDAVKILAVSAKAATAGLTDTATATKAVTAVLNAYNLKATDARAVSDVLFQTVNKGVLTFEELSTQIGDLMSVAPKLGVGIEELGGALATLTLQGGSAAERTTQLKGVMIQLLKPGKELAGAINKLGFDSGEAMLKQLGLVETIRQLDTAAKGNQSTIARWMKDIRAITGFTGLAGDQLAKFTAITKSMDAASKGAGATAEAFAEQSKSLSFQWDRAKASLTAAAIPIAQLLFPALVKGAEAVSRFAGSVSAALPGIKAQFSGIAGVIGDVGRSLFAFAKTDIGTSVAAAALAMVGFAKAVGGAKAVLAGLMGIGLGGWGAAAAAAVGLLTGALVYLSQQGSTAENAIRGVQAALDALRGAGTNVQQQADQYAAALSREESAMLARKQALRDRALVMDAVAAGDIKGKDAALAVEGAELRVKQAYDEANRARKDRIRLAEQVAESQRTERQAADATAQKVAELAATWVRARDVLDRGLGRDIFGTGAQAQVESFNEALEGTRAAAAKLAGDSSATEFGRRTAAGIVKAVDALREFTAQQGRVPKKTEITTILRDAGVQKRIVDMIAGLLRLDKTDAEPQAKLGDASFKRTAQATAAKLKQLDGTTAAPTVGLIDKASAGIRAIRAAIGSLPPSKTVTITTIYRTFGRRALAPANITRAGGGFVPGQDTGGRDSVPALLAPGEVVLNRSQQQVFGGPQVFKRMFGFDTSGVPGMAGGGFVQSFAGGGFVSASQAGKALQSIIKRDKKNSGYKAKSKAVARLAGRLDANRTRQDNLARSIGQDAREYDISVEEFIRVDADGNETLDTGAVQQRVSEIDRLIGRYNELLAAVDEETAILKALIAALEAAIKAWQAEIRDQERVIRETTALIKDATAKMNAATDPAVKSSYQAVITRAETTRENARSKIEELRGNISQARDDRGGYQKDRGAQQYDRRDVELDVKELNQEKADTLAIRARPPEPTSAADESAASAAGADGFGDAGGGGGGGAADDAAAKENTFLQALNDELRRMVAQLKLALGIQQAQLPVIASFQRGTLQVPRTGPYMLHGGEQVVPAGFRRVGGDGAQTPEIRVVVNVADGMEWLRRFIDVRVESGAGRITRRIGQEADRMGRAGETQLLSAGSRRL